ncbi:MAG: response regulator, partial [SAR324 cluster bacterium]|nr:response regulator [SAR324 cluster bacterium]
FGIFLLVMVITGGKEGEMLLWSYIFPILVFFLLGKMEGAIGTILFLLAAGLLMLNPSGPLPVFVYPQSIILRYIISFIILGIFAYNYESVRSQFRIGLLAERSKILGNQKQLQAVIEENEETNRKLEESIIQSQKLTAIAETANQSKGQYLANISHEIRTPLGGIVGFTDLLLETPLNDEQIDFVKTIGRSGETLLALINDVLDFSKIESGKTKLESVEFDPELLAFDVCELVRPKIAEKPIEILCNIGDTLPASLKGDPLRIRQILTNLMGNAVKFTETGEISLTLSVEEETEQQIKLHIMVQDTGPGIPEKELSNIFKAFQQANNTITRKYGGTGLGLSISRDLAHLMGGDIWVESELNLGSRFHVVVFLGKAEDKVVERAEVGILTDKRILVIDDNPSSRNTIFHYLETIGVKVQLACDGPDALKRMQEAEKTGELFDMCLCDTEMPGMSGYEFAENIRRSAGEQQRIPLIALSSNKDAKLCEQAGFDGFVAKPVRRSRMFQMMVNFINRTDQHKNSTVPRNPQIATQYSIRENIKRSIQILLVDDNLMNQKLATMILKKAGYQIEVANDGQEAVDKIVANPKSYDLVLMDIQMPVLDGLEATRILREKGFDKLPIIAITAHALKGDRERFIQGGMSDYTTKPIKREVMLALVKKWIFESES